jgi:hypothetical protein
MHNMMRWVVHSAFATSISYTADTARAGRRGRHPRDGRRCHAHGRAHTAV